MNPSRRKIIIVDASVAVTGALVSARDIADVVVDDTDVGLVLPDHASVDAAYLDAFSTVFRLPIRPLRRKFRDILLYLPYLLLSAFRLRLLLYRYGADTLVLNDFYLLQGTLVKILGFRGQIITWIRIDPALFGKISHIWLWAANLTSDRMVTVSAHLQRLLSNRVKTEVIYSSVSADFLQETPSKSVKERIFVYLANYIPGKGQDIAIEALANVVQTCPDAKIEFYGGDMGLDKNRSYRRTLEQRVDELNLQSSVSFHDFVISPRAVLLDKFAALNLSKSESFSHTVLEASACGLPVIATRCGGPEEIVEHYKTGFLIAVGDISECAMAMISLCNNPALAAEMGAAGRLRSIEIFSRESFKSRLMKIFEHRR